MSRKAEFETTVCNGFPVLVKCTVHPAEPEVGQMSEFGEDFEIFTLRGKPAPFIEKKMSQADFDRLHDEIPSEGGWFGAW